MTGRESGYTLDDLPRFSPWPARLLGIEPWEKRHKTPDQITREYEGEKWGPLLAQVQQMGGEVTLDQVNDWLFNDAPPSLRSVGSEFRLMSASQAYESTLDLFENTLKPFLPASALVELGAGYGGIILALAKRPSFARMPVMAGEYTPSGRELLKRLAKAQQLEIKVAQCDFAAPQLTELSIPRQSLIFTSFAASCVPILKDNLIRTLSAYHPKTVVFVEPIFEHCQGQTLIELMRRRYIELNDYNTNLLSLLREQQKNGLIRILEERPAVLGVNPLIPVSVLVWTPQLPAVGSDKIIGENR